MIIRLVKVTVVVYCMLAVISSETFSEEWDYVPKDETEGVKMDDVRGKDTYKKLVPVISRVKEIPIYAYGDIFINGVCPDFETDTVIQQGNHKEKVKIKPKKSWEIEENHIGSGLWSQPCSTNTEFRPFLGINLIDDNPETFWTSRHQAGSDVEPAWIRIDLPMERKIGEVVLLPRKDGQGIPSWLTIRISCDGWHWTTVYDNKEQSEGENSQPLRFSFEPTPAKQVWIIAKECRMIKRKYFTYEWEKGYGFSLAEVQVLDEDGENMALASRGTGVTVSSTDYGHGRRAQLNDMLWPLVYDLGLKWLRFAGLDYIDCPTPLQWHMVEREKGKYFIDPHTDEVITETAKSGVQITLCLTYGNLLYQAEPKKNPPHGTWWLYNEAPIPLPLTPEAQQGYKNFARFMVQHFKGRIPYYEVWNEPYSETYWSGEEVSVKKFCDLVKEVSLIIKKEDPQAKVILGGCYRPSPTPGDWLHDCIDEGICEFVDVLAWHPFYNISMDDSAYESYPQDVQEIKRYAQSHGFKGEYMANEILWSAPYPPGKGYTEIEKAKNMSRCFLMHLGLGVYPFWCEAWQTSAITWDVGLLRNTFSSSPEDPVSAQPAYYVLRTLCTMMENAKPIELKVDFSNRESKFDNYSFILPDGKILVAIWLPGESMDRHPGIETDIILEGMKATGVTAIDTLNGFEQELEWNGKDDRIVIPNVLIRDYPLVLKLQTTSVHASG